MKTYKQDDQIMKLLGVNQVRRVICDTDKGRLDLMIRKGESKYFLVLDAVPLEPMLNKELMDILFPIVEVPQVNKETKLAIEEFPHSLGTGAVGVKVSNKRGLVNTPKKAKTDGKEKI